MLHLKLFFLTGFCFLFANNNFIQKHIYSVSGISLFNTKNVILQSSNLDSVPGGGGTPSGKIRAGGSRPQSTCVNTDIPLTAILENNGNDKTNQGQPTFLFYIPYSSSDISLMEFTLLDETGRRGIYETQLSLLDGAGIIRLDMSDELGISLIPNTLYQWNFKLYCQGNSSYEPDHIVNGWIKRVDELDDLSQNWQDQYQLYRDHSLWHDAISTVAGYYAQEQQNFELQSNWTELLEFLKYPELVNQPFVEFERIEIE